MILWVHLHFTSFILDGCPTHAAAFNYNKQRVETHSFIFFLVRDLAVRSKNLRNWSVSIPPYFNRGQNQSITSDSDDDIFRAVGMHRWGLSQGIGPFFSTYRCRHPDSVKKTTWLCPIQLLQCILNNSSNICIQVNFSYVSPESQQVNDLWKLPAILLKPVSSGSPNAASEQN